MDIYEIRQLLKRDRKTLYDVPLRVTYYARVSSTSDLQLNSIDNQESYFIEKIKANPNWTFVPGYVDEVRG
ncbi:MAG: recombinase family protein, partial [Clostridiales bacterium]|nr:recombinase family protein [Clostridiales bacterium]